MPAPHIQIGLNYEPVHPQPPPDPPTPQKGGHVSFRLIIL